MRSPFAPPEDPGEPEGQEDRTIIRPRRPAAAEPVGPAPAPSPPGRPAPAATRPAPAAPPRRPGTSGLQPGTVLGHTYTIEALIARGSLGEVYRARHIELGTTHAIKVIAPALANNARI